MNDRMNSIAIIPARYSSSRFPGKPLADLGGKAVVQHVWERVKSCTDITKVIVATDDERIYKAASAFGAEVILTSDLHESGTNRCGEVMMILEEKFDLVINVQGDEPFIEPTVISNIIELASNQHADIFTMARAIKNNDEIFDSNIVKVVCDEQDRALYFSRSPIPFLRDVPHKEWSAHHTFLAHAGIYAYKSSVLRTIVSLAPSSLEIAEKLEQLRWLEDGFTIKVGLTDYAGSGIDTPADLEQARKLLPQKI